MRPRLSLVTSFSIFLLLLVVFPTLAHSEQPDQRLFALQQTTHVPNATTIPSVKTNKEWKPVEQDFSGVTMMLVPPGCFMMGSTESELDDVFQSFKKHFPDYERQWLNDETPMHEVCITAPFWIDKTEVSQAQFTQFSGKAAKAPQFSGSRLPVEQITWIEAQSFCNLRGARLPTEAEWEFAACGPESSTYPWGNTFEEKHVNYCDSNCEKSWRDQAVNDGFKYTAPVGNYADGASWTGALDMIGNVWEWVGDWYITNYYATSPKNDPQGLEVGYDRVVRGNSWINLGDNVLRAAARGRQRPDEGSYVTGFRCVRNYE